jgi:hypothetical protein
MSWGLRFERAVFAIIDFLTPTLTQVDFVTTNFTGASAAGVCIIVAGIVTWQVRKKMESKRLQSRMEWRVSYADITLTKRNKNNLNRSLNNIASSKSNPALHKSLGVINRSSSFASQATTGVNSSNGSRYFTRSLHAETGLLWVEVISIQV